MTSLQGQFWPEVETTPSRALVPTAAPPVPPAPEHALGLRWYQNEALSAVQERYAAGTRGMVIALPTGAGKTVLAAHIVKHMNTFSRCVFLVHRDELVAQTERTMHAVMPDMTTGVAKADRNELDADMVIASVQTVSRERRLDMLVEAVGTGQLFIADECSHAVSPTWRKVIERMEPGLLIGLSATPKRADGIGLDALFEEVAYHLPMLPLVQEGHLARPVGLRIETEVDLDDVHTRGGEFIEQELDSAVDTPGRNALVVAAWCKHAFDRQRTLAFCASVQHAINLKEAFLAVGVAAAHVSGEMGMEERREVLDAFHEGKIRVLTNCQIAIEGYDEPTIDCILMCRPTKSQPLYIQMIGRGLRKYANKPNCLVIDVCDNTLKHKLVTLPSLSGMEAKEASASGGGGLAIIDEEDRREGQFLDLFDAMAHKGKIREKEAIMLDLLDESPFHWRPLPGNRFMAPLNKGWVTLIPEGDGFVPVLVNPGNAGYLRLWDQPADVDMAMAIAESRIPKNALTRKDAGWRRRPASEAQIEAAMRWRISVPKGASAGQVSDLIDLRAFESAMRKSGLRIKPGAFIEN